MASATGRKVKVTTDEGQYIGIIHSIDWNEKRLTLAEVTCLDTGKSVRGLLNFYGDEVEDVMPVEEEKKNWVDTGKISRSVLKTKLKPAHFADSEPRKESELLLSNVLLGRQAGEESVTAQARDSQTTPRREKQSDPEIGYTLINKYNETFDDAIKHLKAQDIIGLSAEAIDMGRHGHLCWLAIASRQKTYLFDVITLGDDCFKSGLASILQSVHIQKVIHDCRRLSDLMYHKYNTELVNVFDTQVAYVIIYRNKTGVFPHYVQPLSHLLSTVLKIDKRLIHVSKIRMSNALEDQYAWCRRPAGEVMLKCLAKTVVHLVRLRQTLLEMMLADFVRGVDIYLCCLRDLEDNDVYSSQLNCQHVLPSELSELQVKGKPHKATSRNDKNGFSENINETKSATERQQNDHQRSTNAAKLRAQEFNTKHSLSSERPGDTQTDWAGASDQEAGVLTSLTSDLQRIVSSANSSQLSCNDRGKKLVAAGHEVTMWHVEDSKDTSPEGRPARKKDKDGITASSSAGHVQASNSRDRADFIQRVSAVMKGQPRESTSTPRHKVQETYQGSLTSLQKSTKSNRDSSKESTLSSSVKTGDISTESNSEGAYGLECRTEDRVVNAKKSYEILERASKILSEASLSEELSDVLAGVEVTGTCQVRSGSDLRPSDSLHPGHVGLGRGQASVNGTPNRSHSDETVCPGALSPHSNIGRGRGALGLSHVNIGRGHVK